MKKFFGYIFLVCGVLYLPKLFLQLSSARDIYEAVGLICGNGLIFLCAYFLLRKEKSEKNIQTSDNVECTESHSVETSGVDSMANLQNEDSVREPTSVESSLLDRAITQSNEEMLENAPTEVVETNAIQTIETKGKKHISDWLLYIYNGWRHNFRWYHVSRCLCFWERLSNQTIPNSC